MNEKYDSKKVHWLNLRYTEQQCPGMREILASAPNDQQSALVRGILYQWCLIHKQQGTLEQAIVTALNGPGVKGQRGLRRSAKGRTKTTALAHSKASVTHPENVAATSLTALAMQVSTASTSQPSAQELEPSPTTQEQPAASDTAAEALFKMFDH